MAVGIEKNIDIIDLGIIDYREALKRQHELLFKRINGEVSDTIIFAEHDEVLTFGRTSTEEDILCKEYFAKKRVSVFCSDRGGDITYHAPGQLLVYPIIDLKNKKKDVSFYIDLLEEVIAGGLNSLGIKAERVPARRGIWTRGKKIGFIGIGVKKWVTFHGACVNINNDIEPFKHINPCGEKDIRVTSAKKELRRDVDMEKVKNVITEEFINAVKTY